MNTNLIPKLGTSGIYTLVAPFDNLLLPNVPYKCIGVRSLADIVASGGNPEEEFYKINNLTSEVYLKDYSDGVCIVSLQTTFGTVTYVPSSFIDRFPDIGGISYRTLALAISIGAVPDTIDLSAIKTKLEADVLELLGVFSNVNTVVISPPTTLSDAAHQAIEVARQARINTVITDHAKYLTAIAERDQALSKIVQLETFIHSLNLPQ